MRKKSAEMLMGHELVQRSASSLRRDSSEFEFDFSQVYIEGPPLSPKLQAFSPTASSINDGMIGASTRDIHAGVIGTSVGADQLCHQKKRANLRSLMLERPELEQFPGPLVGVARYNNVVKRTTAPAILKSSPSSSSSASYSSSVSSFSPQCNIHDKKSKRWSFKLHFLQTKEASPISRGAVDDQHDPAVIDELSDADYIDVEPPRRSTRSFNSISSSGCSTNKREKVMNRGAASLRPKAKSARAPVSPSKVPSAHYTRPNGSPRTPGVKRPISPHAHHYQQQRARAEELRRRTFLPYRPSLFGACLFQSPPRLCK